MDNMGTAYNPAYLDDATAYSDYYSIDEEYENDVIMIKVWKEIKNGATDTTLDYYEYLVDNGGEYTKAVLRNSPVYGGLVEYPGWARQSGG